MLFWIKCKLKLIFPLKNTFLAGSAYGSSKVFC